MHPFITRFHLDEEEVRDGKRTLPLSHRRPKGQASRLTFEEHVPSGQKTMGAVGPPFHGQSPR